MKVLDWFFSLLSGLVAFIPAIVIFVLVILLAMIPYISSLFYILSAWLKFVGEWKWNNWWTRAWHEVVLKHKEVKALFKQ